MPLVAFVVPITRFRFRPTRAVQTLSKVSVKFRNLLINSFKKQNILIYFIKVIHCSGAGFSKSFIQEKWIQFVDGILRGELVINGSGY